MSIKGYSFFCSWSGGKDSSLAYYSAVMAGGKPAKLFTALREDGEYSGSHGLPASIIRRQASLMGIPIIARAMPREKYSEEFASILCEFKKEGITAGVFGDIEIEEHREWVENVCLPNGIKPFLPLWHRERHELLQAFLDGGFKATIVSVKEGALSKSFLGQTLDRQMVREIERQKKDPLGERGEFHTVVTDGPIFSSPLCLEKKGQVFHNGYWFQLFE